MSSSAAVVVASKFNDASAINACKSSFADVADDVLLVDALSLLVGCGASVCAVTSHASVLVKPGVSSAISVSNSTISTSLCSFSLLLSSNAPIRASSSESFFGCCVPLANPIMDFLGFGAGESRFCICVDSDPTTAGKKSISPPILKAPISEIGFCCCPGIDDVALLDNGSMSFISLF